MSLKKTALQNFSLYAVTDLRSLGEDFAESVLAAYQGGVDIIQLRSKHLNDRELIEAGQILRICADRLGKLFFVNDRLDIALAVMADGLHLGQDDMPLAIARRLAERAGHPLLLGKSTHDLEQALDAEREGADYIGVGPVFATPTKPGRSAVGLELIQQVSRSVKVPFVAIGGIDANNVPEVVQAGASRIACVRAIFNGKDVYGAAKQLCDKLRSEKDAYVSSC